MSDFLRNCYSEEVHLEEMKLVVFSIVNVRCEYVIRHAYIYVILWPGWLVLVGFILSVMTTIVLVIFFSNSRVVSPCLIARLVSMWMVSLSFNWMPNLSGKKV